MAEPRRLDEDETSTPDVAERRPPSRDTETRRQLLHNEPIRSAESDPVLLPESSDSQAYVTEAGNSDVEDQPARPVRNDVETAGEQPVSLFADADVTDYRSRWSSIQTAFVDEPRRAVEDADSLVKSLLNKLSQSFTQERQTLANQWERGNNVSTEDLRVTLRRYRSFFDRLLNV
jgi:hypothetical protein